MSTALMVIPKPRTPGEWREGSGGCVIALPAEPTPEYMTNHGHYDREGRWIPEWYCKSDVDYYGGRLVAESIGKRDLPLIVAAPKLLESLEKMMHWAEILLADHHPDFREAKTALLMARGGHYERTGSEADAEANVRSLIEVFDGEQPWAC